MNFVNNLIASPGWIFGPAMVLAAQAALIICVRATWNGQASRRLVLWAAAPLALGVIGAMVGGCFWLMNKGAIPPEASARGLMALGYTVLVGLIFSAAPLTWSGLLLRRRA